MVCDIQTDKAVVSMEVDDDGVLAKILIGADSGTTKVCNRRNINRISFVLKHCLFVCIATQQG